MDSHSSSDSDSGDNVQFEPLNKEQLKEVSGGDWCVFVMYIYVYLVCVCVCVCSSIASDASSWYIYL
jgi:bacteriocin-like protein